MKNIVFCISLFLALVKAQKSPFNGYSNSTNSDSECWSKVLLGIDCCPEGTKANLFDTLGDWYSENPEKNERTCGIIGGYCWTLAKNKYNEVIPCCVEEHPSKKISKDGEGDWSEENGKKCAIRHTGRPWNDREQVEETRDEWNAFKEIWEKERYNFERISVFVGSDESKINFAWYSKEKYTPMIRISKNKDMSDAEVYEGTSEIQTEKNNVEITIRKEKYYTNRVTVKNIERRSTYYYQRYIHNKWEAAIKYQTYDDKDFKFIFVGDPQIGGSRNRYRPYPKYKTTTTDDEGNRNDAFNWNRVVEQAFSLTKEPSVFLSAGDQADDCNGIGGIDNQESEYSAFLYPKKLKQIVMATSVGNHEVFTNGFGRHFNVPNPLTNSTVTRRYNGWYTGYNYFFKYNNVLVVVLETNDNRESDYRITVRNAIKKYPDTDWRIGLFHHDIFGNGNTHSQSDAKNRRGVILNVLSKYNFDLVINGHDHVYTSSKFVSFKDQEIPSRLYYEENYKIEEVKKNEINKDPKGTFFVTANCSSGSKFMAFYEKENLDYVLNHKQTNTTSFGVLDFTQKDGNAYLEIKSYDAETGNPIDDSFTIEKKAGSNVDKCWAEKERGLPCCPTGTKPTIKEDGRLFGYDRKSHCGITDYQLLPEGECWAKKYGRDCCVLPETDVDKTDDRGQWGEEFGEECGIVNEVGNKSINYNLVTPIYNCWSDELGYPCCNNPNAVVLDEDKDGQWSIENDKWCGINKNQIKCWAQSLGYRCCTNPKTNLKYTDESGKWGIENNDWCGIIDQPYVPFDPFDTKVAFEPNSIEASNLPKISSECWAEKLNYLCCTDLRTPVSFVDQYGKWGYEDGEQCGIIEESVKYGGYKCLDKYLNNGYKCCKNSNAKVVYTDADGKWGYENDWCMIEQANFVEPELDTTTIVEPVLNTTSIVEPELNTTSIVEPEPSTFIIEPELNTTSIVEPEPSTFIIEPELNTTDDEFELNTFAAEPEPTTIDGPEPTTIIELETNSTIVEPEPTTTVVELKTNSTIVEPEPTTTVVELKTNSTIVEPEPTTTVVELKTNSTIVEPEPTTTIIELKTNSTIVEPEPTTTIIELKTNSTIVEPEPTTTVIELETSSTIVEPEPTTIIELEINSTIVEPEPTTTVVELEPSTTFIESTATPNNCMAEYYIDKKCCINPNTEVLYINSLGSWGREDNEWCVVELYENAKINVDDCWSEKLGYKCCSQYVPVSYVDRDGLWGYENNNWCGISIQPVKGCWSEKYGYKCCFDPNTPVIYVDNLGQWGMEDGNYCGLFEHSSIAETKEKVITSTTTNVATTTNATTSVNTTLNTTTTTNAITTNASTTTSFTPSTTTTTTTITTTTTFTTSTTSTTSSASATTSSTSTTQTQESTICAEAYQQCGGTYYNGPTCCPAGFYCKAYSEQYHGCADERYE